MTSWFRPCCQTNNLKIMEKEPKVEQKQGYKEELNKENQTENLGEYIKNNKRIVVPKEKVKEHIEEIFYQGKTYLDKGAASLNQEDELYYLDEDLNLCCVKIGFDILNPRTSIFLRNKLKDLGFNFDVENIGLEIFAKKYEKELDKAVKGQVHEDFDF